MNILAIDSSKKIAKIALKNAEKNFFYEMEENKSHSEFLLKEIENALTKNNLKIGEIDCFAVVTGPGSFTGIRIGISFVKAFMYSLNKRAVCVDNFDLVNHNIKNKSKSYYIVLNSNNEDFYLQKIDGEKKIFGFSNIDSLNEILSKTNEKVFCDSLEYDCFFKLKNLEKVIVTKQSLMEIVDEKVSKNDFCEINEISPLYIKKSQAEVGLNKKIDENLTFSNLSSPNEVLVLEQKCFEVPYSINSISSDLENENVHQIFAYLGDELVAYISFSEVLDELNLLRICVINEFREYKIATKLMQKMIDYFNGNEKLKSIFLEVSSKNSKAIKLYEKFSFKQISVRENYYKQNDDALIFRLEK